MKRKHYNKIHFFIINISLKIHFLGGTTALTLTIPITLTLSLALSFSLTLKTNPSATLLPPFSSFSLWTIPNSSKTLFLFFWNSQKDSWSLGGLNFAMDPLLDVSRGSSHLSCSRLKRLKAGLQLLHLASVEPSGTGLFFLLLSPSHLFDYLYIFDFASGFT